MIYCPDYPNSLELRLSVRAEHLVAAKADLASGAQSAYVLDGPELHIWAYTEQQLWDPRSSLGQERHSAILRPRPGLRI
jgi:hypothetical protein